MSDTLRIQTYLDLRGLGVMDAIDGDVYSAFPPSPDPESPTHYIVRRPGERRRVSAVGGDNGWRRGRVTMWCAGDV